MQKILAVYCLLSCSLTACKGYYHTNPTIADMERLMDDVYEMNSQCAQALEISNDDTYLTDDQYEAWLGDFKAVYTWRPDADNVIDYYTGYSVIRRCNLVFRALDERSEKCDRLKGTACFFRAYAFYNLAQLYCVPYDLRNLEMPGISLPLDMGKNPERSTVQETYKQIIADLQSAVKLLPDSLPNLQNTKSFTSPSKTAAFAMLSRTYLCMQDYRNAERYADSCLKRYHTLINYNRPGFSARGLNSMFDEEVIFHATGIGYRGRVDSLLYRSFSQYDLRKTCLFVTDQNNLPCVRVHEIGYLRNEQYFNGLATDEMYLIRAEARIRNGNIAMGIDDLNTLLVTRYEKGKFVPVDTVGMGRDAAIRLVLRERRKSLLYRGLRWSDVRRLNIEGKYPVTLRKQVNGEYYTMLPDDLRSVLLIPQEVMETTTILQNPR